MKNSFYLLILILFSNCHNRKESMPKLEKAVHKDSVIAIRNIQVPKNDTTAINKLKTHTLTKKSMPFTINGVKCYWVLSLLIEEGTDADVDGKLVLKNKQSNKKSDYYFIVISCVGISAIFVTAGKNS